MKRLLRFGARGSVSALGPLESEIMDALWLRGGWSSAPEIMPRFASRCAYSTIKTVLNNLSVKGHGGRADVRGNTQSGVVLHYQLYHTHQAASSLGSAIV
ncbi:MAG: BlaI/MecI/CopY family transcriptional regulator [Candidatus Tyrphobacter sp.]